MKLADLNLILGELVREDRIRISGDMVSLWNWLTLPAKTPEAIAHFL